MFIIKARKKHEGMELFDLLRGEYADFSDKMLTDAFRSGNIGLNGEQAFGDDSVTEGDVIGIYVPADEAGMSLKPEIVYQDENLVIVDKPAGLLSISDKDEPNAVQMAEDIMRERGEFSKQALMLPYLVYPLEKYVSGLLLLAKHEQAYLFLAQALSQRRITRYFVCPVLGTAQESAELMAYLRYDKLGKNVCVFGSRRKNSKPIVTRYKALAQGEKMSLLRVRTLTNYLHQVRAHLAFAGLPVVGDADYGNKRYNRKHGARHISLWLQSVVFEMGKGHEFEYLNGVSFVSKSFSFPKCVYDEGLFEDN